MKYALTATIAILGLATLGAQPQGETLLPNGWTIGAPSGPMTGTDTMPQGAAASPDGRRLAVLGAGYNQPSLRIYAIPSLEQIAEVRLADGFGRPVWVDGSHILVAGGSADALFDVDIERHAVNAIKLPAHSYPVAVAFDGRRVAVATDGDTAVRIGMLDSLATATPVRIGGHIGGLVFAGDGTVYASNSSARSVAAIEAASLAVRRIKTGLHPTALLTAGNALYVAESDDDAVGIYDRATGRRLASIAMSPATLRGLDGSSPNALARSGDTVFVSLGAANGVAVLRKGAIAARIPTGWYPTDVVPLGRTLYVIDGKGEDSPPNPYFNPSGNSPNGYVASLQYGSIRAVDLGHLPAANPVGTAGWSDAPKGTLLRPGGPIRHVFFILKENRSYDEVLGDVREGNGDAKLVWFGERVTPNQHLLAERFGLFDNTYTDGEVSEAGHYWADAGFVNDYVQRTWPSVYANRNTVDAALSPLGTALPKNGYIWQAARKAHVTMRVYGEFDNVWDPFGRGANAAKLVAATTDKRYVGWNVNYSDVNRAKEWRREFQSFVRNGALPQLEYIWLPNDHTAGSHPGKLTPVAYAAQNDYATGLIVDAISHSSVWQSSAIFITEDDAQSGPDHVSDQRTTFFLVSPFSRGGLQHGHYSTTSIVRAMESIVGIAPLSAYDATATRLDAALTSIPDFRPFDAVAPHVSITVRNTARAYGAKTSAALDLRRPDAVPPGIMNQIIAHNLSEVR